MNEDLAREFLGRLEQAGGKASMWKLGESLGLDRADTETLAVDLLGQGLLEMVSLSGAVQFTEAGRAAVGGAPAAGGEDLPGLLAELAGAGGLGLAGTAAADLTADLAALSAHLTRSSPLMPVVKALTAALDSALEKAPDPAARELRARLARLAG